MVLTQSCDLVRRKRGECRARYITISAVRPLQIVLDRRIQSLQGELERAAQVCRTSAQAEIRHLLERLYNNNDDEYFYLHRSAEHGLSEDSCSFIRLSAPLTSCDNYDMLCDARFLGLRDVFSARLGWQIGNIFSRVATDDFVPTAVDEKDFRSMIRQKLEEAYTWRDDRQLLLAKKAFTTSRHFQCSMPGTEGQLIEYIDSFEVKDEKEEIADTISEILSQKRVLDDRALSKKVLDLVRRKMSEKDSLAEDNILQVLKDGLSERPLLDNDAVASLVCGRIREVAASTDLPQAEDLLEGLEDEVRSLCFLDNDQLATRICNLVKNDPKFTRILKSLRNPSKGKPV